MGPGASHKLPPWKPRQADAPRAVLFDAYGTLFDVYSVGVAGRATVPRLRRAPRRALARQADRVHPPDLDERPAAYAFATDPRRLALRGAPLRPGARRRGRARADGAVRAARAVPREPRRPRSSCGGAASAPASSATATPTCSRPSSATPGFADLLDPVLSVEGTGRFKTDPAAYALGTRRSACRRRDPVRLEQLLGRDRRHLVRLHDALGQPLRPAARRARRATDAHRHAARRRARLLRLPRTFAMTLTLPAGMQINAPILPGFETVLTPARARAGRQAAPRVRAAPPGAARRPRRARQAARRRRAARLPRRDRGASAPATGRSRRCRRRCNAAASRSPARSTRKMVINAFNSGADTYMTDFEDSNSPLWTTRSRARSTSARRSAARCRSSRRRRPEQELQAQRQDRDAAGAPARLAPRREARDGRRQARLRRHLRLRAVHVPQRQGAARARRRAVLLPAQDREPPRGAPLERHLRHDAERARPAAGHDQGDGADRDHPRRVRDGRDPVRAARALGRPQRRPLGLHLQLHQEVQAATATSASPTAPR